MNENIQHFGGRLTKNKQPRSRLSYANELPDLAKDNPLIGKTGGLTNTFEKERCPLNARQLADGVVNDNERSNEREAFKAMRRSQGQGSGMVQNHNPFPELKPTPELANAVKDASHNSDLIKEQQRAQHQSQITEGKAIRNELLEYIDQLKEAGRTAEEITKPAPDKTLEDVEREGFKLLRRMQAQGDQVLSKSQTFRRSFGN